MENLNKVILVTGSSRGIGQGVAFELAANGYDIAINYSGNKDAAIDTMNQCKVISKEAGYSSRFQVFKADIGVEKSRKELLESVVKYFGDCHGLVNNAGIAPKNRADLLDIKEEDYDRLLNINLKGSFFLSQMMAKYWLTINKELRGFRSLTFVSSVSSKMVSIERGEYCIAKAGVSMVNKLFAMKLANENIGVYEVRPGIIATSMTSGVKSKYDDLIDNGLVPQKRWGTPKDVGKAILSLVKGDFSFSTGTVINIDGGLHVPQL